MTASTLIPQDVVKHTPSVAELLPDYAIEIFCEEPDCDMSFRNRGQFNFHMTRHHRKVIPKCAKVVYHCPVEKCIFHQDTLGGRSCSKMSLIRQHYQKVHVEKEYMCEKCGKKFLKISDLTRHQANESCEEIWQCDECGWKYTSRESLLTHGRRKRHIIGIEVFRSKAMRLERKQSETVVTPQKKPAAKQICVVLPNLNKGSTELNGKNHSTPGEMTELDKGKIICDIETQTKVPILIDESPFVGQIAATQTSFSKLGLEKTESEERQTQTPTPTVSVVSVQTMDQNQTFYNVNSQVIEPPLSQDDLAKLLCHMETQTESQQSSNSLGSTSAHMYTQTCNELMEALGLNLDVEVLIETPTLENPQTHSILPLSMIEDYVISTATQTNMEPVDSSSNCDMMRPETSDDATQIMNWPSSLAEDFRVSTATQTKLDQYFLSTQLELVNIETQTMNEDVDMTANTDDQTTNTNYLTATVITDDFLVSTETQTSFTQCLLDTDSFLNVIEQQTTTESPDLPNVANCLRNDDFLVTTETQTSYDQCLFTTELSLADIETQTNWSFNDQSSQTFHSSTTSEPLNLFNDKATTVTDIDFLVSTETQTNFTNCLINDPALENSTTSNSYGGLYLTQYTQTCDELLEELFCGGQDNMQCSYTQT